MNAKDCLGTVHAVAKWTSSYVALRCRPYSYDFRPDFYATWDQVTCLLCLLENE